MTEIISSVEWSSGSVTVPTDATAAYAFWAWENGGFSTNETAPQLNSEDPDQIHQLIGATTTGIAVWYEPATGSRTFALNPSRTPEFGPAVALAFTKGGDIEAWRSAGSDAYSGSTSSPPSFDLTSQEDDFVFAFDTAEGAPSNPSGWTSERTGGTNFIDFRLRHRLAPSGSSTTITAQRGEYPAIAAIAIPAAETGGTAVSFTGTVSNQTYTVNQAITALDLSTFFSGDLTPFVYSVHSGTLPTGLSLNTSTGAISGTPTVAGTQTGIVIRAMDDESNTADTNSFSITVEAALTFTTTPSVKAQTSNSYTLEGTLSEQGEVYAVAVLSTDTAPTTEAQIVAGNNGSNAAARGAGDGATAVDGTFSISITGTNLGDNQTHDIYYVGRWDDGT